MSTIKNHSQFFVRLFLIALVAIIACANPSSAQEKSAKPASATSDPIIKAMLEELERSKSQVKMDNVAAPYYIEYRLSDVEEFDAEAAFGALREDQRAHIRSVRVVVRVGDYKEDSYYQQGMGVVEFAPVDNDAIALRRQLWGATDRAYKAASEALATKKAELSKYSADQPFDDFAKAPALQSIGPLACLDFSTDEWKKTLAKSTDLFRTDPQIQSLSAYLRFRAVNQYFVNTEGTITREGYAT